MIDLRKGPDRLSRGAEQLGLEVACPVGGVRGLGEEDEIRPTTRLRHTQVQCSFAYRLHGWSQHRYNRQRSAHGSEQDTKESKPRDLSPTQRSASTCCILYSTNLQDAIVLDEGSRLRLVQLMPPYIHTCAPTLKTRLRLRGGQEEDIPYDHRFVARHSVGLG